MDERGSAPRGGQGPQLSQLLLQTPAFAHFTVRQVQPLLAATRARPLRAGDVLWRAGEQPRALFVVLQGAVQIVPGGCRPRRVEPVDVAGDIEVVAGLAYGADATAAEASLLLEVPVAQVEQLLANDTAFCQRLCRNVTGALAARLQEANERLGALTRRRGEIDKELERARVDLNDRNLIRQLRHDRGG